ncbi:putative lipoprotein [Bacteriovorax sp. Seq25_V]|nr:putative lipoprotein [Bacteriovorax sp. Seq25_V]
MSSLVKSALWAISLLLISCFFGSVTIDYSKEFYSILIIAVTILAVIL